MIERILLTVLAAAIGTFIASKIKIPVPFMIGGMIGSAVFNIATGMAAMPSFTKTVVQSLSGVFIGLSLKRKDIRTLKELAAPLAVLVGCLLVFTTVMGLLFHYVFGLDPATAFLVAIPGGVTEISLMATDVGAEPAIVSFMQTFRLFSVYLIFPATIAYMSKRYPTEETTHMEEGKDDKVTTLDGFIPDNLYLRQLMTALIGLAGGILGKLSGLPSGTLSFAMIFTILANLNSTKITLKREYKRYVQLFSGALIGVSISMETVRGFTKIVLPSLILILGYLIANFIISYLMAKTGRMDRITAMFASSPGGASDMALIASEIGGDSPKIAVMHIIRLIACYTIFPMLAKILIEFVTK